MARLKVLTNCKNCNGSFRVKPSHLAKRRYCSRPCYDAFRRSQYEIRFWNSVNKTRSCWLWLGEQNKDGYGVFNTYHKPIRAHRAAFELVKGSIPTGLFVLHACDTPLCVNPDHLYTGTQLDNMRDRKERGRHTYGSSHPNALFSEAQIREVRNLYAEGMTQIAIGHKFGADNTTISMIVNKKTWKHVN